MSLDLRTIARATGGTIHGRQVLCPGPGHSRKDNSLSIRLSARSPLGFIVYSHAGDDFREARDYVASKLGLGPDAWKRQSKPDVYDVHDLSPIQPELNHSHTNVSEPDNAARIARARAVWDGAGPAQGTSVEIYLTGRGLSLDLVDDVHNVLRFHPACPWGDKALGRTIFVPAMVVAMRQIEGDAVTAVHRTRLTLDGVKVDRMVLGLARAAAVKLSGDGDVTLGLHVAEGVETALAGLQFGLRPCWALGSAGAIATFPVLGGVEALSLLAEHDDANARAVEMCAARWHAAGAEVNIIRSTRGNDLNDVIKPEVA